MFTGLTSKAAADKLKQYGFNELSSAKPKNIFRIAKEAVKEPMFLLLISCAVLYMILGNYREGVILLIAVLVIIFITFYQYRKTERALEALKSLASPRALVIRDGNEIRIPGREVVPDDVLLLNEGDRIAADAIILDSVNLTVDESLLTGESVAVMKMPSSEQNGTVFSGTLVVQGKGIAKVITTGTNTQFGKIGTSLQTIEQHETRLQKEMKRLITNLFLIGAFISVGVVFAFYFTRGNFIQSLLTGLASAMSILPEEFPVVLTVFLAIGAWRLSRKNVLTRKPTAIETLGSITVLCADKTGTITQNKMEIVTLYNGVELIEKKEFLNKLQQIKEIIGSAHHASVQNSVDPMEQAISTTYKRLLPAADINFELIKEYPLSRQMMAMTQVIKSDEDGYFIAAKGAPESIFRLCRLDNNEIQKHETAVHIMAQKGYRVIAVANAIHSAEKLPEAQQEFHFEFIGLIGFEDPVRCEVPDAIKECTRAGIKVIMITGDFPVTAKSIATQIGIAGKGEIITGAQLNEMTDDELKRRIKNVNVFARAVPEQKLRIVQALKANNEVVAMTGDGVNDAPALKAADIGIAMGNRGTDVAREASSLVLLDDNFASIIAGMRQGRRIFDNLQKAMSYILSVHIPIIGLALLPAIVPSVPLLLLPMHIVFLELVIDPTCSVAFESEQEEKGIMDRPPRNPKYKFFGAKKIWESLGKGTLLLAISLIVCFMSIREGHTVDEVRAITFAALIIGNVFLILTDLSKTRNCVAVFTEKNYAAISIFLTTLLVLVLVIYVPALQKIFSFQFPGFAHFIPSVSAAITMLLILEIVKLKKRTAAS